METMKQFIETLTKKLKAFIDSGDLKKANTVTANMMASTILIFVSIGIILCWILNEFDVFTISKTEMRIQVLVTLIIQVPINIIVRINHGDKPWVRGLIEAGLILNCSSILASLGYNATLIIVLPVILAVRYYDRKFTSKVAWFSVLAMFLATIANTYYGVANLNMVDFASGTQIIVADSFRETLLNANFDQMAYLKNQLLADFLPRFACYLIIATLCVMISDRGNQMIDLQKEISSKTARVSTELNLATQIQAGMLPCIFPAFPTHTEIELFARNIPAKEVGGDFYDYFKIDDDHVAVVMADVSGKGVGAALFMSISKTIIKNLLQHGASPAAALEAANRQLCENNEAGLFVTVWAGVYEISTGAMTYVNAGHNPPVIMRKGEPAEMLHDKHCFVLAGFEESRFTQNVFELHEGDELMLYTDGVTEAQNINLELYGDDRWVEFCERHRNDSSKQQVEQALAALDEFKGEADQFDDITIMAIKFKAKSGE